MPAARSASTRIVRSCEVRKKARRRETSTTAQYNSTGKTVAIRHIHVANPTAGDITFTMSIGADASGTRLFDAYTIPQKSVFSYPCNFVLVSGDGANAICANAGSSGLVLTISGVEVT